MTFSHKWGNEVSEVFNLQKFTWFILNLINDVGDFLLAIVRHLWNKDVEHHDWYSSIANTLIVGLASFIFQKLDIVMASYL